MKKITKERHIALGDRVLPLPISKGKDGFYVPILTKIDDQLRAMLSHHCKVFVIRIDLRLYSPSNDNSIISDFIRRYRKRVCTKYKLSRLGYVWCREQDTARQHHYHLAILIDGNKARRAKPLYDLVKRYWDELQHLGASWDCSSKMLKRGDDKAYCRVFENICYLAKVYSKSPSQRSASANDYEGSRIKHKEAA